MVAAAGLKPRYRGFSHVVAVVFAVLLAPPLIVAAPGVLARVAVGIYAASIIGLFGISAAYHRKKWSARSERVMRRLDHSMIFVAIAGTYTPISTFALPVGTRGIVLALVWIGALAGIAVRLFWQAAPAAVTAVPYLIVGWTGLLVVNDLSAGLGGVGFSLLIAGGALFSIGALIYATRWPDLFPDTFGFHEVFHLFVIAGVAVHYVTVAFFALPLA